jgi:hypothetical protein
MNDPTVPTEIRLLAAEDLKGTPRVTLYDMIPPHLWLSITNDVAYIEWCVTHGPLDPNQPASQALYAKARQTEGQ